jgi:hypothetical protein
VLRRRFPAVLPLQEVTATLPQYRRLMFCVMSKDELLCSSYRILMVPLILAIYSSLIYAPHLFSENNAKEQPMDAISVLTILKNAATK